MARQDLLKPIIRKWEGNISEHPNDPGGLTKWGITIGTFRNFYGRYKTRQDLINMTEAQWDEIFKKMFWDRWKADEIQSQSIANLLVDWVWASGIYGIKYPQQILGVTADGKVGQKTLAAINGYPNQKELFIKLWNRRKKHFKKIVKNRPASKVFLKGWMNRLNDFKWVG